MRKKYKQVERRKKSRHHHQKKLRFVHVGMADWDVALTQQSKGMSNVRANLGVGAIIAGGEANLFLNYDDREPFSQKQQYYNWRYVNNDHAALRQVTVGKIFAQSISSIYAPVTGIQLTNTPTTYRQSFGTQTLSNITEPGWTVELYVNNVLLNYTKADASGFFTFEVPLVYGNSLLKLRFYGPLGEEQERQEYMNIPYNFVPLHQLEYTLTAGVVSDEHKGRFSRANVNYGLSKIMSIGGGIEYLSTITSGKSIPFVNASVRLGGNTLVSAEHAYGVRTKAAVNFRLLSNLQLDLNYIRYNKTQTAVLFNYLEEKKVVITKPFQGRKFTAFSRLTVDRFTLPVNPFFKPVNITKNTSAEFLLSTLVSGISSNLTTYALFNQVGKPVVYSAFSMSFRVPGGFRFIPRAQYDYNHENFSTLKAEVEKNVFHNGFMNLFFEKDLVNRIHYVGMSLRYNFSFAQTSFSAIQSNEFSSMTQAARGSLIYGKGKYLQASNQSNVGKGGLIIAPFLDVNCNGKRDAGEPKVSGLKLRINGGRIVRHNKDSTLRIIGLEAYTSYYIELDKNSFDNIAWQIQKPVMSVAITANELKCIEVPVSVVGEVSGTVLITDKPGSLIGLARIIVSVYKSDSSFVGQTLTESDGYFSLMGLAPGSYTARLDAAQLQKLNMTSSALLLPFTIKKGLDGDVADGLEFELEKK